ncbi:hypothetical protein OROGR_017796 [Orobanche gracilis]
MMKSDYGWEQSLSIKLMKTRFDSRGDDMRPTMLPQLDINFHFICKFNLSEWLIQHDDDDLKLVRQSRFHPSIKNVVRRTLMEFLFYNQTREAIGRVLGRILLPDSMADHDEELRHLIDYATEKASDIINLKPTDRNVLDLYFNVSVQHNRVFSDAASIVK